MKMIELANWYKLVYAILRRHANNLNRSNARFTFKTILEKFEVASMDDLLKLHKELFDEEYKDFIEDENDS